MRVGVIQSNYIPWRGYFDFIASVDLFVFHDDIQYTKGDWRNRNQIKTERGPVWLTVPVTYNRVSQLICHTPINYNTSWGEKHLRVWASAYRNAPFFDIANELIKDLNGTQYYSISKLNINLIKRICNFLKITTPMVHSSDFSLEGSKTERLIDLLIKLKATTYLSGPSADGYLQKNLFQRNKINLEYKSYVYEDYPQLWGNFVDNLTVLDLIANCGEKAPNLLRSKVPNKIVLG